MKRLIALFALIAWVIPALAQTPEEILSRMEEAVSQHESDGVVMTIDIKIPLLGTLSTTAWSLGDKMSGVTTTIRNVSFGVTEEQVTFDMSKYPGAKVVDKR